MSHQDSPESVAGTLSSILSRVRFLSFTAASDEGADERSAAQRCPLASKSTKETDFSISDSKTCPFSTKSLLDSRTSPSSSRTLPGEDGLYSSRPTSIPKRLWSSQPCSSHSLTSSGSSACFTNDSLPFTDSFNSLRDDEEFSEPEYDYAEETEATLIEKEKADGDDEDLPVYTLEEVSHHDMPHDCWMVLFDQVYDLTDFLLSHPGGEELLLEHAGRDATLAYRGVGHSRQAAEMLRGLRVGRLPDRERTFRGWHLD